MTTRSAHGVIYDLDSRITNKYSEYQTSHYSIQVSFRFHSLRCSDILVFPSICTKIRIWSLHRTKEVSNIFSIYTTDSNLGREDNFCIRENLGTVSKIHIRGKLENFGGENSVFTLSSKFEFNRLISNFLQIWVQPVELNFFFKIRVQPPQFKFCIQNLSSSGWTQIFFPTTFCYTKIGFGRFFAILSSVSWTRIFGLLTSAWVLIVLLKNVVPFTKKSILRMETCHLIQH